MKAPKRKMRRGRRRSKAERLARKISASNSCNDLSKLLQGSSSCEWDAAQSVALQMGTLGARGTVVRMILTKHQAPRAAAHYAKRLNLRGNELLSVIWSSSSPSSPPPLLLAQFLVELDEDSLATDEKLQQFLWPWLLQMAEQKHKAIVKAAVHLLLHPTASNDAKVQEKKERGEKLECALVTMCLKTGKLLHLVPTHSRALGKWISVDASVAYEDEKVDSPFSDKEMQRRQNIARCVQTVLRLMWPDARVLVFGSSVTGLLSSSDNDKMQLADVDLCALLPSAPQFHHETAPLVTEVKEHLSLYFVADSNGDTEHVTAVTRARVPIVHFVDPFTNLPCDLCVNNVSALWNTRLLRWLLYGGIHATSFEQRQLIHVRKFCKWLRDWRHMKKRVVGGALSSYGLVLLALYYLQRTSILPVLDCSADALEDEPTLRALSEEEIDKKLEAADKTFVDAKQRCGIEQHWKTLRCGFFRFYSCIFDYEQTVVSLRTTEIMSKVKKSWFRQHNSRLCLEDPIETKRDLGLLCSKRALSRLRCAFAHACIVLSKAREGNSGMRDVEADLMASWVYEDENDQQQEQQED